MELFREGDLLFLRHPTSAVQVQKSNASAIQNSNPVGHTMAISKRAANLRQQYYREKKKHCNGIFQVCCVIYTYNIYICMYTHLGPGHFLRTLVSACMQEHPDRHLISGMLQTKHDDIGQENVN